MSLNPWSRPKARPQPTPRSTLIFADDESAEQVMARKSMQERNRRERDLREGQIVDGVTVHEHGEVDLNGLYGVNTREEVKDGLRDLGTYAVADLYAPHRYEGVDPRKHPIHGSETPLEALARQEREAEREAQNRKTDKLREDALRLRQREEMTA